MRARFVGITVLFISVVVLVSGLVYAQGPQKRTVHKFIGNGECIENEIPVQAPANGWLEGPCPDTVVTPAPTETPTPEQTPITPGPSPDNILYFPITFAGCTEWYCSPPWTVK